MHQKQPETEQYGEEAILLKFCLLQSSVVQPFFLVAYLFITSVQNKLVHLILGLEHVVGSFSSSLNKYRFTHRKMNSKSLGKKQGDINAVQDHCTLAVCGPKWYNKRKETVIF